MKNKKKAAFGRRGVSSGRGKSFQFEGRGEKKKGEKKKSRTARADEASGGREDEGSGELGESWPSLEIMDRTGPGIFDQTGQPALSKNAKRKEGRLA